MKYKIETIKLTSFTRHADEVKDRIAVAITKFEEEGVSAGNCMETFNVCSDLRMEVNQLSSITSWVRIQGKHNRLPAFRSVSTEVIEEYNRMELTLKRKLACLEEYEFNEVLKAEGMSDYILLTEEWRRSNGAAKEEEDLLNDLQVDGLKAWGDFYHTYISKLSVPFHEKRMSVGQVLQLRSDPCEKIRRESFYALENLWKEEGDVINRILNHSIGFAVKQSKRLDGMNHYQASLRNNHVKDNSVQAMWERVDAYQPVFQAYLNAKAEWMGKSRLAAYDFWAPLSIGKSTFTYDEAVSFILIQFGKVSQELKAFAEDAIEKGWIDAENRPSKSFAASCIHFPKTRESRVNLSFDGSFTNILTLAHELGHAFHNEQLNGEQGLHQTPPLPLAETSSIFAELAVLEGAMQEWTDPKDRLFLLDEKLKRSVMNFMNIRSRFVFERAFEEERERGFIEIDKTDSIMRQAWEASYQGSLVDPPSRFWALVPHFYMTNSPYYNYPYTMGYLISLACIAKGKQEEEGAGIDFRLLLKNSGKDTIENLVRRYFEEDIATSDFWEKGLEECAEDVREFTYLVNLLGEN
ncbi:M3 family metallopeptidase [Halobacillus salinus]|uniref:Pantothenate kinase n=1 Tax=Halobacillus salinus TaxID=192814 RepID=A0A4Z0H4S1_9BACI|nr:M3 family metallopeptidase [Halobacillus salinus]TGB04451.1 pantothenate kinase [Halobacillus salinus]